MVVLKIQIEDLSFTLVDSECDPPVPGDGQAPCPLAVAGELVGFPARDVAKFQGCSHLL